MCFPLEKFLNFMRCTINIHHSELSRCNCSFNICNQVVGVYGMSKQLPYPQPDARRASKCTTLFWIALKKCHGCIFSESYHERQQSATSVSSFFCVSWTEFLAHPLYCLSSAVICPSQGIHFSHLGLHQLAPRSLTNHCQAHCLQCSCKSVPMGTISPLDYQLTLYTHIYTY